MVRLKVWERALADGIVPAAATASAEAASVDAVAARL